MSNAEDSPLFEQTMNGILALLAAEREERINPVEDRSDLRKTEVILSNAGMTPGQIASILGKNNKLVSQTIIRAKRKTENAEK